MNAGVTVLVIFGAVGAWGVCFMCAWLTCAARATRATRAASAAEAPRKKWYTVTHPDEHLAVASTLVNSV